MGFALPVKLDLLNHRKFLARCFDESLQKLLRVHKKPYFQEQFVTDEHSSFCTGSDGLQTSFGYLHKWLDCLDGQNY